VNVVQQFDLIPKFRPQMVEQFGKYSDVRRRIQMFFGWSGLWPRRPDSRRRLLRRRRRAIGRQSRHGGLHAYVAITHFHTAPRVLLDLLEVAPGGVEIKIGAQAHLAPSN